MMNPCDSVTYQEKVSNWITMCGQSQAQPFFHQTSWDMHITSTLSDPKHYCVNDKVVGPTAVQHVTYYRMCEFMLLQACIVTCINHTTVFLSPLSSTWIECMRSLMPIHPTVGRSLSLSLSLWWEQICQTTFGGSSRSKLVPKRASNTFLRIFRELTKNQAHMQQLREGQVPLRAERQQRIIKALGDKNKVLGQEVRKSILAPPACRKVSKNGKNKNTDQFIRGSPLTILW